MQKPRHIDYDRLLGRVHKPVSSSVGDSGPHPYELHLSTARRITLCMKVVASHTVFMTLETRVEELMCAKHWSDMEAVKPYWSSKSPLRYPHLTRRLIMKGLIYAILDTIHFIDSSYLYGPLD